VIVVVVVITLDRVAVALMRPRRRPPEVTPGAVGLRARDWVVQGRPPLNGWWIDGGKPTGPVVLVVHGWGANTGVTLPLARFAAPMASHVITFDARGHGRNSVTSQVNLRTFREDVRRAVEAVKEVAPQRPLVILAHSMGGAGSILAAAGGSDIAGLLTVAAPYHVYDVIVSYLNDRGLPGGLIVPMLRPFWRLRVGVPEAEIHPGKAAERLRIPMRVVHPEHDTRVVPEEGVALAQAAGVPLVTIPDAGHTDVLQKPRLGEEIVRFLDEFSVPGGKPAGEETLSRERPGGGGSGRPG
jgi:alpha-beta hydrolase superfamily lysophospholipase